MHIPSIMMNRIESINLYFKDKSIDLVLTVLLQSVLDRYNMALKLSKIIYGAVNADLISVVHMSLIGT